MALECYSVSYICDDGHKHHQDLAVLATEFFFTGSDHGGNWWNDKADFFFPLDLLQIMQVKGMIHLNVRTLER